MGLCVVVMASEDAITGELGLGEIVSKTFDLFRRDFVRYFAIFAIAEVVVGLATLFAYSVVKLPAIPANPTGLSWVPGYFAAFFALYSIIVVATFVVVPIAEGTVVKMVAETVEGRPVALRASVTFVLSKLVGLWFLTLVVGVVVVLGSVALIVPGIILGIMFCLAFPAFLLENTGVFGSLSRSRELVGHRWGKTFGTFLVIGLIILIISVVVTLVSGLFGSVGPVASAFLSSFYEPILPIALTVYFFSNRARITSPQTVGYGPTPQEGTKFCSNCGTRLPISAAFCANCGAKQPT